MFVPTANHIRCHPPLHEPRVGGGLNGDMRKVEPWPISWSQFTQRVSSLYAKSLRDSLNEWNACTLSNLSKTSILKGVGKPVCLSKRWRNFSSTTLNQRTVGSTSPRPTTINQQLGRLHGGCESGVRVR